MIAFAKVPAAVDLACVKGQGSAYVVEIRALHVPKTSALAWSPADKVWKFSAQAGD